MVSGLCSRCTHTNILPNRDNNIIAAPLPCSFSQDCLSRGRVFKCISAVPIINRQKRGQQQQQGHHNKNHQYDYNDANSSNGKNDNSSSTIYAARVAAESNEDLYRIFHHYLKSLSDNTNYNDNNDKHHHVKHHYLVLNFTRIVFELSIQHHHCPW